MRNILYFGIIMTIFLSCSKKISEGKKQTNTSENIKITTQIETDSAKQIKKILAKIDSIEKDSFHLAWLSINEAQKLNKIKPKKMIMDFYTKWCGPCKLYDQTTFANKDVLKYINKNFYAVKFNAEGNDNITFLDKVYTNPNFDPNATGRNYPHQFSMAVGINSYPTVVFWDENYKLLHKQIGIMRVSMIEIYLKLFHSNAYLQTKTTVDWNTYQKNFINEFKE